MEIFGTFEKELPIVEGESNGQPWKRGGFVIVTGEEYPRYVAFEVRKEELLVVVRKLRPKTPVHVKFVTESREVGERWFTSLKCFAIEK